MMKMTGEFSPIIEAKPEVVLLHNGDKYASVPVVHSVQVKDTYLEKAFDRVPR